MESYQWEDMEGGYFVGDFEPAAAKSGDVEISFKYIYKGTLDAQYYRSIDTETMFIARGQLDVDGTVYKKNDILVWEPNEIINIFALEDSEIFIIKMPGTARDTYRKPFSSYEEARAFYGRYFRMVSAGTEYGQVPGGAAVDPAEVSVVVQGQADGYTRLALKSIREFLPGAYVILSTWKGCCVDGMDYDRLVLNDDPGAVACNTGDYRTIMNNGNRQIVSTKAGLAHAGRKYTLKMRSDLMLLGDSFLSYYVKFSSGYRGRRKIFRQRVMVGELYTRENYVYKKYGHKYDVPKPFHPSDWFYFGLTEDVKALFGAVGLIPEGEMRGYPCKYPGRVEDNLYRYSWRYTTEQHIFLGIVKKHFPEVSFEDWTDWGEGNIRLSREAMMDNFMILNFCQHGILNQKYVAACFANNGLRHSEEKLMTHQEFLKYLGGGGA